MAVAVDGAGIGVLLGQLAAMGSPHRPALPSPESSPPRAVSTRFGRPAARASELGLFAGFALWKENANFADPTLRLLGYLTVLWCFYNLLGLIRTAGEAINQNRPGRIILDRHLLFFIQRFLRVCLLVAGVLLIRRMYFSKNWAWGLGWPVWASPVGHFLGRPGFVETLVRFPSPSCSIGRWHRRSYPVVRV